MIHLGQYNRLKVVKKEVHGFYLDGGDEWGTILLPNKNSPEQVEVGDEIDVFVYFDSKDIIIATTQKPYAVVGDFASLTVVSVESIGVFLDWGIDKDLFVPLREQLFKMLPGESYAVYVYVDSSGRIAASTRIAKHLQRAASSLSAGDSVDLLLYQQTDLGIKAVINNRYDGLIYRDDIMNDLKLGQRTQGFVKLVRPDGKVDLTLQSPGSKNSEDLTKLIVEKLKESGGSLPITAKTSANTINSMFGVSRKKFKIALGALYKEKIIAVEDECIRLLKRLS